METAIVIESVIVLAVCGIIFLGLYYMCRDISRIQAELDAGTRSFEVRDRKWDWLGWVGEGAFILAVVATAWIAPALLLFVWFVYLIDELSDQIWFEYVDRSISKRSRDLTTQVQARNIRTPARRSRAETSVGTADSSTHMIRISGDGLDADARRGSEGIGDLH